MTLKNLEENKFLSNEDKKYQRYKKIELERRNQQNEEILKR